MFRTPAKDRTAKKEAVVKISEISHQNKRPRKRDEADGDGRLTEVFHQGRPAHLIPEVTIETHDNASVTSSRRSRQSITASQIDALEKRREAVRRQHEEKIERQAEINKIELQMLEMKKKQLEQENLENQQFMEADNELEDQINELYLEAEQEEEEQEEIGAVALAPLKSKSSFVRNWVAQSQAGSQYESAEDLREARYIAPSGIPRTSTNTQQRPSAGSVDNNAVLMQAFKALQDKRVKDLPTFNGEDLLDWPLFKGEFDRSTEEFNVKPSDNIRRLTKALQGKAKQAVRPLLNDPDHIPKIMKILEMNFGRKDWVMSHLMNRLEKLNPVVENDIESFKTFYNHIFTAVHAAENVNGIKYLDHPKLILQLAEKLPPFSKEEWKRERKYLNRKYEDVTIQHFLLWLEDELDTAFEGYNPVNTKGNKQRPPDKKSAFSHMNTDATRETKCRVCSSRDHVNLSRCETFKKLPLEQRRATARNLKVCYNCLGYSHDARQCKKDKGCTSCSAAHHTLLHKDLKPKQATFHSVEKKEDLSNDSEPEDGDEAEKDEEEDSLCADQNSETADSIDGEVEQNYSSFRVENTVLRIGNVRLIGPKKTMTVAALFDEGSQSTMIEAKTAKELGLEGELAPVTYQWTGKVVKHYPTSTKVNLKISGPTEDSKVYDLKQVRTIENLGLPKQQINIQKISSIYKNMDLSKLEAIKDARPMLLIGSDHAGLTVPRKTFSYHDNGLQLTRSNIGWTIHGRIDPNASSTPNSMGVHLCAETEGDDHLTKLIEESFKIENFGIINQADTLSKNDERALQIMEQTIKKVDGRYEIGLPYKYENFKFPASKTMAIRRLHLVEKKMDADPHFAKTYCEKIEEYLNKTYASKLADDKSSEDEKTFYIPHLGVTNPNKPGKWRFCMDCRAKTNGMSLNDLLLKGVDFVPPLLAVLWRARIRRVAFMADITEMFHQIVIRKEDRNSQRFLWRGMRRTGEPDIYVMNRMIFGAISSPSQAQFVKNYNARAMEPTFPGVTRAITQQHYVDDYFDSVDTEDEAIRLIQNVRAAHEHGGFKLVKFMSNSKSVYESIPVEDRATRSEEGIERVLGIKWNVDTDEFESSFNIPAILYFTDNDTPTKRQVLKAMMSVFDPMGILQPTLISLKIFFQDLWRLKLQWDEPIPEKSQLKFSKWLKVARGIGKVIVPRSYFPNIPSISYMELHVFCDASDKAAASALYVRIKYRENYYVSFVGSKTKIGSIKHLTVPRLELQACVIGSELARTFQKEIGIPITKRSFWTDSKIVLSWFRSTEKLSAFVGSRVTKIFEDTEGANIDEWNWIPSKLNVADLATKENDEIDYRCWLNGPDFLRTNEEIWPKFDMPTMSPHESVGYHEEIQIRSYVGVCKELPIPVLPDISRFSNLFRLLRATAYFIKMVQLLQLPKKEKPKKLTIGVKDIQKAREIWYRKVQLESFGEELSDLNTKGYVKGSSRLYTRSPVLYEDNIIRLKGRIQESYLSFDERNPVILPNNHPFTKLLITDYHERNLHCGIDTVVNNLKQHFDIIHCRQAVRKVFRSCITCRQIRAKPTVPEMGQLPASRITAYVTPFHFTGLDYFGPLTVTVGRRHEKRWVALFTCMVTRACHIEVVSTLSTSSAIMAMIRFMNIRGVPKEINCDNATCFHGADNELREFKEQLIQDEDTIRDQLSIRGVEFKFVPPGAPHFAGSWERKVRSIKNPLDVALKETYPSDEILKTVLSEIVNMVNNTPLVEVSCDPEAPRAIVPNDILMGRINNTQFDVKFDEVDLNPKTWKSAQVIADRFWPRYVREKRPLMQRRSKWHNDKNTIMLQVDDVVLVADENLKRNKWPKGTVVEVHPGPDSKVRAVTIKTQENEFKRPVSKIVFLFRPSQHQPQGLEDVEAK